MSAPALLIDRICAKAGTTSSTNGRYGRLVGNFRLLGGDNTVKPVLNDLLPNSDYSQRGQGVAVLSDRADEFKTSLRRTEMGELRPGKAD